MAIADEHFSQWCFHNRSFKRYKSLVSQHEQADIPRNFKSKVFVFWGATGTGKSRAVHTSFPGVYVVFSDAAQWFDGYEGHENVVFDDFNGFSVPISYMLKLLDRYPFTVQVKGGTANWRPRRIFLTSNLSPDHWYMDACSEHRDALKRRLDVILEFPFDNLLINFEYDP